jgi:uncharacterized protein (TIGR02679 family)
VNVPDPSERDEAPSPALLRDALETAGLRRMWTLVRAKVEEQGGLRGRVRIPDATLDERIAIRQLGMGRTTAGALSVDLVRLDSALRGSALAVGVVDVLTALGGAPRSHRVERRECREAAAAMWAALRADTEARRPELLGWLDDLRRAGALGRLGEPTGQAAIVRSALDVVGRLPPAGGLLSVVAAELLGDAHALDRSRPLGRLVASALRAMHGALPVRDTEDWRDAWRLAGIDCDTVSASCLVLGVRLDAGGHVGRALAASADAGEPARVTLRMLRRDVSPVAAVPRVFVCENPSVVEVAADRLGSACPPLVCTEGQPTLAVHALLDRVHAAGAQMWVHADFDWAGMSIVDGLRRRHGADPWRFDAATYRRRARRGSRDTLSALGGRPPASVLDPELLAVMRELGGAVYEEGMVDELLADMADAAARKRPRTPS